MRVSRKSALLQAATEVVQRDGVSALTLDAVARQSGVSKGGVLYHFPTKEALVLAMVTSMVEHFEGGIAAASSLEPRRRGKGRWLRAYIHASLTEDACAPEVLSALVAATATNPALLDPLRERYQDWQQLAAGDGVEATWATIIRLAVDGLWFADMFDLAPPRGALRRHLVDALLSLTSQAGMRAQKGA